MDKMQIRSKETQLKVVGTKGGRYIQELFEENINTT